MKNLKFIFSITITLIFASTAFAQSRVNGKVIGVADGRTIVIGNAIVKSGH